MTEHSIGQVDCQKLAASLLGHGSICDRLLLFNNPTERSRWESHLPSPSSSSFSSLSSSQNLSSPENKQSPVKGPQKHPTSTLDTNHIRSLLLKRRVTLQQARSSSPPISSPISRGPLHQLRLEEQPVPLVEPKLPQQPQIQDQDEDEDREDEGITKEIDQSGDGEKKPEIPDAANRQNLQQAEITESKDDEKPSAAESSNTAPSDPKTEQESKEGDDDLLNDLLQNDDETDIQKLIELSQQTQQSLSSSSSSSFSPTLPLPSLSFAQPPPSSNPAPSTASDPSDEDLESWLESVI